MKFTMTGQEKGELLIQVTVIVLAHWNNSPWGKHVTPLGVGRSWTCTQYAIRSSLPVTDWE
jgi:hypothetical protein